MNLFQDYQKKFCDFLEVLKDKKLLDFPENFKNLSVELPPKKHKSDLSCNAAMVLSKFNNQKQMDLAAILKKYFLDNFKEFETIEVANPGFLNFNFKKNFWENYIFEIIQNGPNFGSNIYKKKKYNIEFVSANPTGPLHVGHCRGAIIGDVISNLLKFNGHDVIKEYYVNDFGGQIKNFVLSVYHRILEIKENKKFPINENLYPGLYIINIAKKIIEEKTIKNFNNFEKIYDDLLKMSLNFSVKLIKNNLNMLGVVHDSFVYESELIKNNTVTKVIDDLKKNNYVYEGKLEAPKSEVDNKWKPRNQLLFNSSKFDDDTDRPLQKIDGSWTYFASDIAYHSYKVNRKYDVLINILGADHAGYIKRIKAAVKALSNNEINLVCKVSQLVKLFKKGQPFKMSKRKGDYVTVEDLINEVGKDSVRFMMLNRNNDVELDFDFEKVSEKSKENPVFYVQYAYARINSIFSSLNLSLDDDIKFNKKDFSLNDHEIEILKKISEWPKCVEISLLKLEPHRIPYFLYDLSTLFHSYWNMGKDNEEYRFVNKEKSKDNSKLAILKALSIVIKNGMSILGVSTPKSM